MKKNDFSKTVRVPLEYQEFVNQFADKWSCSSSYIWRSAIKDFIAKHQSQQVRR